MAHPKWYQRKQYKQPMPRTEIDKGHFVEVKEISEDTLLILREWPNGNTDRIRSTVDEHGQYNYEIAPRDRFGQAKEFIGDPDWYPPRVYSNPIPGTSPSSISTYDPGTGRDYETRKDLLDYYEEKHLQLVSANEMINMHERAKPKPGRLSPDRFYGKTPNAPEGTQQSISITDLSKV